MSKHILRHILAKYTDKRLCIGKYGNYVYLPRDKAQPYIVFRLKSNKVIAEIKLIKNDPLNIEVQAPTLKKLVTKLKLMGYL